MLVSLGISAGFHDSSACIVSSNGTLIYAASEERYTRVKGERGFPTNAVNNALDICLENGYKLDKICLHEDFFARPPSSFFAGYLSVHGRRRGKKVLDLLSKLEQLARKCSHSSENIIVSNHHESHAYSAIGFAPFDDGIILVLDAIGEDSSGLIGKFKNRRLISKEKIEINKSLGLIYSLVTVYCGFRVMTGEYKVMGLAPYGDPIFIDDIEHIFGNSPETLSIGDIDIYADKLRSIKLEERLDFAPRDVDSKQIRKCDADLAASVQLFLERRVIEIIVNFLEKNNIDNCNLALSGGVALNCKLNLCLSETLGTKLRNIWAFPASGDAGSSVGACMKYYFESGLVRDNQKFNIYSGLEYTNHKQVLKKNLLKYKPLTAEEVIHIVDMLVRGSVGGIFEGQAEFGPRALGHRSIIASAQNPEAIRTINRNIKSREDFRPLAPIILRRNADELLYLNENAMRLYESMLCLARSRNAKVDSTKIFKNSIQDFISPFSDTDEIIPSAVHLDGTARVQIIDDCSELIVRRLLDDLDTRHGIKALVNTSMNVRGEPVCETLADSLNCFKSSGLDFLIVEDCVLYRADQDPLVMANFSTRVGID